MIHEISQHHHIRIASHSFLPSFSCRILFIVLAGVATHLGHNSLALEASPHAVVDTLGLPPALANAVEAVTLVTLELRSALLDDRDMLLCGDHLCGCRLVIAPVGGFAAGKLESEIVDVFCSSVSGGRRTFAVLAMSFGGRRWVVVLNRRVHDFAALQSERISPAKPARQDA